MNNQVKSENSHVVSSIESYDERYTCLVRASDSFTSLQPAKTSKPSVRVPWASYCSLASHVWVFEGHRGPIWGVESKGSAFHTPPADASCVGSVRGLESGGSALIPSPADASWVREVAERGLGPSTAETTSTFSPTAGPASYVL